MDLSSITKENRGNQKLSGSCSSPQRRKRKNSSDEEIVGVNGFSKALHRFPPPLPPNLLKRLGVQENYNVGKVKVMLRVFREEADNTRPETDSWFFSLDKKRKQVTLYDPTSGSNNSTPEDRRVGVAAPKMFAFDAIFSNEDSQAEISSSALVDIVHAVIDGTDGCIFCYGHPNLGKSYTMIGNNESVSSLGIIPCAISWLYRSIAEQKQKTGARFSVRVSAVAVGAKIKDLLVGQVIDGEQSPSAYLRDDPLLNGQLLSQSELRAPTPEKAAHYLDYALSNREDAHLLFTLHVYQYSVASKGGVAGVKSRLHFIDLGSLTRSKESSCLSLSAIGNVLIAIFNSQKHLPHREHKLTQVLRECLSSLTCQAAMIAHVSPMAQNYPETLSTIHLASRIHRMRRRRPKYVNNASISALDDGGRFSGSSDIDPSSSEQSADTVIYVGGAAGHIEETDGEHPPVYIPSLASGDNRPCLNSSDNRSTSIKPLYKHDIPPGPPRDKYPISKSVPNSPQRVLHSNVTKSPWLRSPLLGRSERSAKSFSAKSSPSRSLSLNKGKDPGVKISTVNGEERWIDGPRISRSKVVEARNLHLLNKGGRTNLGGREMWVDGPLKPSPMPNGLPASYGFMDSHKKSMIRQWVENQTLHIQKRSGPRRESKGPFKELTVFKTCDDDEDDEGPDDILNIERGQRGRASGQEEDDDEDDRRGEVKAIQPQESSVTVSDCKVVQIPQLQSKMDEDNDNEIEKADDFTQEAETEIIEVIELEETVPMQDSCLQVTEEDIAKCMGEIENPLPEVDQEEHPLRILSQENLTVVSSFTDPQSVLNDIDRLFPPSGPFFFKNLDNGPRPANTLNSNENKFEQLSRLHDLYRSKMGLTMDSSKKISSGSCGVTRCQSLSLSENLQNEADNNSLIEPDFDNSSIVSEPAYLPGDVCKTERFCDNCRVSLCGFRDENALWQPSAKFHSFRHLSNLSSLRHPDGASNPNLRAEVEKREPAEGAKEVDDDEEEEEMAVPPPLPTNLLTLSRESFECLKPKHICDNVNRQMSNSCSNEQVHDPGGRVLHYCREDVQRLERGWNEARRNGRLRELKREQRQLMAELAAAKCRILLSTPGWNKELSGI